MRGPETPTAPLLPPSLTLRPSTHPESAPGLPGGAWVTRWLYGEVTFLRGSGAQPSLQVSEICLDLLQYPYQACGAGQTAWGSAGTSRQPNPVV